MSASAVRNADKRLSSVQNKLQDQREKIEQSRYLRCFKKLDSYGESNTDNSDPGDRPKSVCGGVVSLGIKIYVVVLVIIALVQLFTYDIQVIPGNTAYLNYISTKRGDTMDFPALVVNIETSLTFFQGNAPNIQRIDMIDQFHYSDQLSSQAENAGSSIPPVTKSITGNADVDFNTFDTVTAAIPSPRVGTVTDIDAVLFADSDHEFQNTLRYLILTSLSQKTTFFNHTAVLFTRFQRLPISQCMTCQLQVQWMNVGELNVLRALSNDFNNQSYLEHLTSLTTTDSTWYFEPQTSITNADGQIPNVFRLLKSFNTAEMAASEALQPSGSTLNENDYTNWRFAVAYVNNFNTILDDYTCRSNNIVGKFQTIVAPTSTATVLQIVNPYGVSWTMEDGTPLPSGFQVYVSGNAGVEIMSVLNANYLGNPDLLQVQRSSMIEFNLTLADQAFFRNLSSIPPGMWDCDPTLYNDGYCTCGCGAPDPACVDQTYIENCDESTSICDHKGRCAPKYTSDDMAVYVSKGCKFDILLPSTPVVVGYLSTSEDDMTIENYCKQCTGDSLTQQTAVLDNGVAMCNLTPRGVISGLTVENDTVELHVFLDNPNVPFPPPFNSSYGTQQAIVDPDCPTEYAHTVVSVSEVDAFGYQSIVLDDALQFSDGFELLSGPYFLPYAQGNLVTAISAGTTRLTVSLTPACESDPSFTAFNPASSPIDIYIEDGFTSLYSRVAQVLSGSHTASNETIQSLILAAPSSNNIGAVFRVTAPVPRGSTRVPVFPIQTDPFLISLNQATTAGTFPVEMAIVDPFDGSQFVLVKVTNVRNLYVPYQFQLHFGAGDGCDCIPGSYDPDCAWPTPQEYTGLVRCYDSSGWSSEGGRCVFDSTLNASTCDMVCNFNGTCVPSSLSTPISDVIGSGPCTEYPYELELDSPLPFGLQPNALISTGSAKGVVGPMGRLQTLPTVVSSLFNIEAMHLDILHNPLIDPDRAPYLAADRWKDPPLINKDVLPMEYLAVVVPDLIPYGDINLCPNTVFVGDPFILSDLPILPNNPGFDKQLLPGRGFTASCAGFSAPPACDPNYPNKTGTSSDDIYDLTKCQIEMPAVKRFNASYSLPVNQRWTISVNESQDPNLNPNTPEYTLSLSTTYYFTYDQTAVENEDSFSAGEASGGDLMPDPDLGHLSKPSFFSALYYMGLPGSSVRTIPANSPLLTTRATLMPDAAATQAFLNEWKPRYWKHSSGEELVSFLTDGFNNLDIQFELSGAGGQGEAVFLNPGKSYTLQASISMTPLYSQNKLGIQTITGWQRSITATRVDVVDVDYFHRQTAEVNYVFTFAPQMVQQITQPTYGISNFLAAIGSAIAYTSLGLVILRAWIKITEERQKTAIQPEFYADYDKGDDYVEMDNSKPLAEQGRIV